MPNRIIRENILTSDRVDVLSYEAEVFYRRLMSVVDDYGRFDGRAIILRTKLYPLRVDKVKDNAIQKWMQECVDAGLIVTYLVDDTPFLELLRFGQKMRSASKYPAPADACAQMPANDGKCQQSRANPPYSYSYSKAQSYSEAQALSSSAAPKVIEPAEPPTTAKPPAFQKPTQSQIESLYQAYPRRVGKGDAIKAIRKAIDRLTKQGTDALTFLLDRVMAYARSPAGQPPPTAGNDYRPHPARWFNDERYHDDESQWQRSNGIERRGGHDTGRIDAPEGKYAGLGIVADNRDISPADERGASTVGQSHAASGP